MDQDEEVFSHWTPTPESNNAASEDKDDIVMQEEGGTATTMEVDIEATMEVDEESTTRITTTYLRKKTRESRTMVVIARSI